ncbi:MAG: site-specific integrase, partial [Malacoplasma sp.]
MKPTDFAYYLTKYLSKYLPGEVGASNNTIHSYRDTFSILIRYCNSEKNITPEKLTIKHIDKLLIQQFLTWIESERNCSASTRNQRLSAIHAFFKYLQFEEPIGLHQYQEILSIQMKKSIKMSVNYLTLDAIKILLSMPNKGTKKGRRDIVLLSLLYDTGCRVQEIADAKVSDLRIQHPSTIKITGKGNKTRIVPIMDPMSKLIDQYIKENRLNFNECTEYPLFTNRDGKKLTRSGITYILNKYFNDAKAISPECFPNAVSPHVMRHSKAMHLLQAGVNLIYIRDLLGHVSIQTTEIYAKADSNAKRKA